MVVGARTRLRINQTDESLLKTAGKFSTNLFKKTYEQINREAELCWRDSPSRFVDGKIAMWVKFKELLDETYNNEIMYLRKEQKKKINSFCVRCGTYKCFDHCNFGDCGVDIKFRNEKGEFLMSDYDDEKHYPAHTNGTPHLLCILKDEMEPEAYHIRVIQEERKLKLRWRRDPNK